MNFFGNNLKNLSIYAVGQAVNVVSPLLVVPFIVMHCGEANLGRIGIGFAFAMMAIVLVDGGSYINGTREIAVSNTNPSQLRRHFTRIYLGKLFVLLVVLMLSAAIIFAVPFLRRDWMQMCLSLIIVVGQAVNPMWFFQGVQNFKWITILNILSKAIYVGGVFWLVSLPADYVYVNALWGLGMIFSGAMGVAVIIINYGFYWRPGVMRHAMLLVFKEFPLTLSQLFFSLYQYIPVVLVGFFGGDFMAGQYRIIEQVVMVFRTGLQTFFNFVYPQVCSVIYQDKLSGIRTWQKINLAGYALVVMALVVFYWQAYPILQFFKVGPADLSVMVHYFRIALFLPLIMGVTFSLRQLVFAFKRERLYIFLTIGATLVMMALLAWLVNLYGLAAVFATLIGVEFLIAVGYGVILRDLTHKPKVNG